MNKLQPAISILMLLFFLQPIFASTYFGYIVTNEGDTIEGKIPNSGWLTMQKEIKSKLKQIS